MSPCPPEPKVIASTMPAVDHRRRDFEAAPRLPFATVAAAVAAAVVLAASPGCGLRGDRMSGRTSPPESRAGTAALAADASPSPSPSPPGRPASACPPGSASVDPAAAGKPRVRLAVIGDFGAAGTSAERVAALVKRWLPDLILTTGDNNYPAGAATTIDANIGQYYHDFISPYRGQFGCGSLHNRFFPSLGNHDWMTARAAPYLDYFTLPGNERYYDLLFGPVHLFALDSDPREPDGVSGRSAQAAWLKSRLLASTARFQIVYMHHPPYSSGPHGSTLEMRWPYREWGVDLVLSGHDHIYERVVVGGLTYVVSGLGGAGPYPLRDRIPGDVVRYASGHGASILDIDQSQITIRFVTVDGKVIDETTLGAT
jgi:tartrate-resistant acid phosphatase type 5